MKQWIQVGQIVLSILLMAAVLLQNRGVGLSGLFGGVGAVYRTKRGIEKNLFIATIVLSLLFFASAVASVILQ